MSYILQVMRNGQPLQTIEDIDDLPGVAHELKRLDVKEPVDDWHVKLATGQLAEYDLTRHVGRQSGYWRRYER